MTNTHRPITYDANIGWLAGLLLLVIFLTYRSFVTPLFYLSWSSGAASLGIFIVVLMLTWRTASINGYTFLASSSWLFIALVLTPFASNTNNHLSIAIVCIFYSLVAVSLSDFLMRSRVSLSQLTYGILLIWVLTCGLLLIAYFAGVYQPAKNDFSGPFHDRNVFSITSLILLALSFAFLRPSKLSSLHRSGYLFLVFVVFSMIVISRSVTGLLGSGLFLLFYASTLRSSQRWLIILFGVGMLSALLLVDQGLLGRIERFTMAGSGQTEQLNENESAYIRLYLMINGIQLAIANLFTGVGLDNARFHILWPGKETGSFLHNTYLDIFTSGGIFLFFTYYIPQWFVLGWLLAKRKVIKNLPLFTRQVARASFYLLFLKSFYDLTWTTYFEFAMVFSVIFAFYGAFFAMQGIRKYEDTIHG